MVTGTTASAGDHSIITGCGAGPPSAASSARNSVWPGWRKPARYSTLFGDRIGDDSAGSPAPDMVDRVGEWRPAPRVGAGIVGLSGARGGDCAGRDHGQGFRKCRARFLRDSIGKLDLQSQDFRPLGEERAIAEQIERRKVQLTAAQPGGKRNIGSDSRRLAGCQREGLVF